LLELEHAIVVMQTLTNSIENSSR